MDGLYSSLTGKGHRLVAHRIDEQLQALIGRQVAQSLEVIHTGFADNYKLETDSLIEAIYYLCSFGRGQPTPGMQAVSLSISSSTTTSTNNFSIMVAYLVAKYSVLKLQTISVTERWREEDNTTTKKKAYNTIRVVIGAAKIIFLLHMVMFLHSGEYPSVIYRIAGCKTTLTKEGPGHSNSQLYMEAKKIMWLSFLGLATAASITIDWQSLKYYMYFHARAVINAVYTSRYAHTARRYASRVRDTVDRYVSSSTFGGRGRPYRDTLDSEVSGNTNNTSNNTANSMTNSNIAGNSFSSNHSSNSNMSSTTSESSTNSHSSSHIVSLKCTSCGSDPAETPHVCGCEHIFCYLCLHSLVEVNTVEVSRSTQSEGGGSCCPACYCPFSGDKMRPWTPKI